MPIAAGEVLAQTLIGFKWPLRVNMGNAIFKATICRVDSFYDADEDPPLIKDMPMPEGITRLRDSDLIELSPDQSKNLFVVAYIPERYF